LISKLSNCQKQKQQVINLTNNTNIVEIIKSKISLELLCSNQKIENIKLVSTDNREYLFNKLIGESPKLVFFFSMLNCNSCIERELERIRQIEKQIGKDNIIILAADFEDYALSAYAGFKRLDCLKFKTTATNIGFQMEENNILFYFVVNRDLIATNIFVPIVEFPEITEFYLNGVHATFFNL
jgi:hypothetical protein